MSDENPTAGLDSAQAEAAWLEARDRGDWIALSQLQEYDEGKPGTIEGLPVKHTSGAKDVR